MTSYSPETRVGEIAADSPLSIRVFEQLGIDFCCGGKVALAEACELRGLDPGAVLEQIARTVPAGGNGDAVDWQSASLEGLIDHILSTHHVYMKSQLPRLDAMLQKVLSKHGEAHGEILRPVAEVFGAMKLELEGHLMKEEMILFPLICGLESGAASHESQFHCGSVQNPIRVMMMEHDSAGDALASLRILTSGYAVPEGVCNTFRALYAELEDMERDLHQHIHLENNILFPRAAQL